MPSAETSDEQSVGHGAADRAVLKWKLYLPRPGQRGRSLASIEIEINKGAATNDELGVVADLLRLNDSG